MVGRKKASRGASGRYCFDQRLVQRGPAREEKRESDYPGEKGLSVWNHPGNVQRTAGGKVRGKGEKKGHGGGPEEIAT